MTKSSSSEPALSGDGSPFDTVIIGGGIAGLTVAYRLIDRNILLLEKEDVPGGRTVSRKMGEYVYNMGAQVVLGDDSLVARLADQLAVSRTLIRKTRIPFYLKGRLVTSRRPAGLVMKLPLSWKNRVKLALILLRINRRYGFILDETLDPNNPKVVELNSMTLDEFIGPCAPGLKEFWNVLAISSTSRPADQVAAYYPINAFLHFLDDEYYVEGGTGRLTGALHERLGSKVETGAEVQEVVAEQGKLKVTYLRDGARQTVLAERCVVAVPAPIALAIVKGLPAWKRDALSRVEFGPGTTAAFTTTEPAERFLGNGVWRVPVSGRRFSSMTNPTITFPGDIKERYGGLVRVFALGPASQELMGMSDGEALEVLAEDLIATLPDIRGKITASAIWHWPLALSAWLPGHLDRLPALQAPADNIYYCGDYTVSAGMEAAVESAYRVADAIDRDSGR